MGRLAISCGGGVNVGVDWAESILLRLMLWKPASEITDAQSDTTLDGKNVDGAERLSAG
jgi:hypothetical protein